MSACLRRFAGSLAIATVLLACGCSGAADSDDDAFDQNEVGAEALSAGWTMIGNGVAYKHTGAGNAVFIGYAGYSVTLDRSAKWVEALSDARLAQLGVGHLYAVRGPTDVSYAEGGVGNSKLASHLVAGAAPDAPFVLVAAHSSGTYVADEFFRQTIGAGGTRDPHGVLEEKIVYANLDGGGGIDSHMVHAMKKAIFVYAQDSALSSGRSANAGSMESLASEFGGLTKLPMDHSGCHSGAKWCLHDLLITTKPHNPDTFDLVKDYTDFAGHPVQDGYIRDLEPILH